MTLEEKLSFLKPNMLASPEPNWTQARNDHSQPLAEGSPIPKEYLYYDHDMKSYVYDPARKPQTITIQVDASPEMTDSFILKIIKQLPEYLPIPYDVQIGVDLSISCAEAKKSAVEWIKWITGHFEGSVWMSNNQIVAMGVDVRKGEEDIATITIVMA